VANLLALHSTALDSYLHVLCSMAKPVLRLIFIALYDGRRPTSVNVTTQHVVPVVSSSSVMDVFTQMKTSLEPN